MAEQEYSAGASDVGSASAQAAGAGAEGRLTAILHEYMNDAMRYRWLRQFPMNFASEEWGIYGAGLRLDKVFINSGERLDRAIDERMGEVLRAAGMALVDKPIATNEEIDVLAKEVLDAERNDLNFGCSLCVPDWPFPVPGFVCARHIAERIVKDDE